MKTNNLNKILLTTGLISIFFMVIVMFGKMYLADVFYVSARKSLESGDIETGLRYSNTAIFLNPNEPSYYRERAKALIASTINKDATTGQNIKLLALKDLETSIELNPKNLASIRNNMPVYYFLGEEFKETTQNYILSYVDYSPNDVGIYVLMAKYQKRLDLNEQYEHSLNKIKDLRPDLLEWHPDLQN